VIKDFELIDLSQARLKAEVEDLLEHIGGIPMTLKSLVGDGLCKTITTRDREIVLGVMAGAPMGMGICEVFVLATEDQKSHSYTFARSVKEELKALKMRFDRVQSITRSGDLEGERFLAWLDFEREGKNDRAEFLGESRWMWRLRD